MGARVCLRVCVHAYVHMRARVYAYACAHLCACACVRACVIITHTHTLCCRRRRNVGKNALTGKFPSWFTSMPAITDLCVSADRSVITIHSTPAPRRQVGCGEPIQWDTARQHRADSASSEPVRCHSQGSAGACVEALALFSGMCGRTFSRATYPRSHE